MPEAKPHRRNGDEDDRAAMIVGAQKTASCAAHARRGEVIASAQRSATRARLSVEIRARAGQRAMALGDAGMSNQVARKNAQGGIDEVCVTGDEAVAKAMSSSAKAKIHE